MPDPGWKIYHKSYSHDEALVAERVADQLEGAWERVRKFPWEDARVILVVALIKPIREENASRVDRLCQELRSLVKSCRAYMKYHAEKFGSGVAPGGLWPAIGRAEEALKLATPEEPHEESLADA